MLLGDDEMWGVFGDAMGMWLGRRGVIGAWPGAVLVLIHEAIGLADEGALGSRQGRKGFGSAFVREGEGQLRLEK